jgi:type IV secretion system protein VirB10
MMSERVVTDSTKLPPDIEVADEDRTGARSERTAAKGRSRKLGGVALGVSGVAFAFAALGSFNMGKPEGSTKTAAADKTATAAGQNVTMPRGMVPDKPATAAAAAAAAPGANPCPPGQAPVVPTAAPGQAVPAIGGGAAAPAAVPACAAAPAVDANGGPVPAITPGDPSAQGQSARPIDPRIAKRDAQWKATLVAYQSERGSERGGGASAGGDMAGPGTAMPAVRRREPNEIENRLGAASSIVSVPAARLANRNFLVTAGTQIPCVLQTAMDTTQPGFVTCVLPRAVFSDNGRVVLLEKGTRVLGEYQGGIQQGQSRLFVIWNRAISPQGVVVSLGSPAADALGRAGVSGKTETFFWKRFGGALLLSLVGDAGNIATSRLAGAQQTTQAPNSAAEAALGEDIRIKPVLRAAQGSEVTIFAARDFDFSNAYSLSLGR